MSQLPSLAQRLQEVLLDGRWIANTNWKEQIQDLTIQSVESLNSIALLTFHLTYYLKGVIPALQGGPLEIRDTYSFDLPPIEKEADWVALKADFFAQASAFVATVSQLDEALLPQDFVNAKYGSYQRNLEAMIEHAYYHLGQVVLIRKMILRREGNDS